MPESRLRWAVEVARWDPEDPEFDFLCSLLPEEDAVEARRFRFREDQKRAVVSRLLQRAAAAAVLGLPHSDVIIKRTKGRKPYAANDVPKPHAPNFNFSVSHEGDYVVLAAEGVAVCGCDVAAPQQLRRNGKPQPLTDVLSSFKKQLTLFEWDYVFTGSQTLGSAASSSSSPPVTTWPPPSAASCSDADHIVESRFRQLWSLKESYVKATGEGLGFELGKTEFTIHQHSSGTTDGTASSHSSTNGTASVAVCGVNQSDWIFHVHQLGQQGRDHWVAVARAPVEVIVDAWGGFTSTLQMPSVPAEQHAEAMAMAEPPFSMLPVSELVPEHKRDAYEAAGGEII